jgi:hypothetical protein
MCPSIALKAEGVKQGSGRMHQASGIRRAIAAMASQAGIRYNFFARSSALMSYLCSAFES